MKAITALTISLIPGYVQSTTDPLQIVHSKRLYYDEQYRPIPFMCPKYYPKLDQKFCIGNKAIDELQTPVTIEQFTHWATTGERPECFCFLDKPVCGTDCKYYDNGCMAKCSGVDILQYNPLSEKWCKKQCR